LWKLGAADEHSAMRHADRSARSGYERRDARARREKGHHRSERRDPAHAKKIARDGQWIQMVSPVRAEKADPRTGFPATQPPDSISTSTTGATAFVRPMPSRRLPIIPG